MKFELFIARNIYFGGDSAAKRLSPAVKIATAGVALGLAVMLLSVAIVIGFKNEVSDKVIGFGSHVTVSGMNEESYLTSVPVSVDSAVCRALSADTQVKNIERVIETPAVFKTDTDFAGVVIKGVGSEYDTAFFSNSLVEGRLPAVSGESPTNEVMVSNLIADQLRLSVGSSIYCYFINVENVKARKFKICGIYKTNFTDYDRLYVVGDIRVLQRVNGWNEDQYTSLEINLANRDYVEPFTEGLFFSLLGQHDKYGVVYYVSSAYDKNPQLFEWLNLLDMNVWIIIVLMSVVAGFTIISGILIIILERTSMIGTLKALGASNGVIRKIFLFLSSFLIIKGLIWGNIIGLVLCGLQYWFKIVKLDPSVYYISAVPIEMDWRIFILLNIGTMLLFVAMVIAPTYIISRIKPATTMRFE